jgi:hypothetical protein
MYEYEKSFEGQHGITFQRVFEDGASLVENAWDNSGDWIEEDHWKGMWLVREAAENDCPGALCWLGFYYYEHEDDDELVGWMADKARGFLVKSAQLILADDSKEEWGKEVYPRSLAINHITTILASSEAKDERRLVYDLLKKNDELSQWWYPYENILSSLEKEFGTAQ